MDAPMLATRIATTFDVDACASPAAMLPAPAAAARTGVAWWMARVAVLEGQRQTLHEERDAARAEVARLRGPSPV